MTSRRQFVSAALAAGPLSKGIASTRAAAALPPSTGPYALPNTFVHPLPDPVTGRRYEVWVDLPPTASLATAPSTAPAAAPGAPLRPAVFVTDAPYAFPLIRALRHRVGQQGRNLADFAVIGLAGPADESSVDMRSRDYTPSDPLQRRHRPQNRYGAPRYGEGPSYARYVTETVLPAVCTHYRLDPRQCVLLGHSYGALLAAQVLLTRPDSFSHYVLGSPSYWFDEHVIFEREAAYAGQHRDLPARVFQYVGAYETIAANARFNRNSDLVGDMRRFEAQLRRRRYPSLKIESRVIPNEDHLTVAPIGATLGLLWALPGRGPYEG